MAEVKREYSLRKWLEARTDIRRANEELQVAQEQLRVLEERHLWLLTIQGILGIKDARSFDFPEGPKVAKVRRTSELIEVPPHQGEPVKKSKHRTGPLMLKAKRQALEKWKRFRISK
jgi:hypothetical protein